MSNGTRDTWGETQSGPAGEGHRRHPTRRPDRASTGDPLPYPHEPTLTPSAEERWWSVVLVEGDSDRAALETLAARRGHDLATAGVRILSVGGATNVRQVLARDALRDMRLTVLCDQAEEAIVRRAWNPVDSRGPEPAVFVCVADLEDELIRAAGTATVLDVVAAQGEDRSFAALRQQPAHRDRPLEHVLRRFMGSRSGRKATYAQLLVEALPLDAVPAPLDATLASAIRPDGGDAAVATFNGSPSPADNPRSLPPAG
jgi:hypothetical protein